jgi:hypothetical protein
MTPLELDHNEKQCFLEWRKTLAEYVGPFPVQHSLDSKPLAERR